MSTEVDLRAFGLRDNSKFAGRSRRIIKLPSTQRPSRRRNASTKRWNAEAGAAVSTRDSPTRGNSNESSALFPSAVVALRGLLGRATNQGACPLAEHSA